MNGKNVRLSFDGIHQQCTTCFPFISFFIYFWILFCNINSCDLWHNKNITCYRMYGFVWQFKMAFACSIAYSMRSQLSFSMFNLDQFECKANHFPFSICQWHNRNMNCTTLTVMQCLLLSDAHYFIYRLINNFDWVSWCELTKQHTSVFRSHTFARNTHRIRIFVNELRFFVVVVVCCSSFSMCSIDSIFRFIFIKIWNFYTSI